MKFIHTADLHIGKVVNEFSMLEEQKHVLDQILTIAKEEEADALVLAGDIYDRSVPSAEAVMVLDQFLREATALGICIFMISGNHDSPERIAFGQSIMLEKKLYVEGVIRGNMEPIVLEDTYGPLYVYLLPFAKPATIRHLYQDEEIVSCEDGVRKMIEAAGVDEAARNILVTHHFVTNTGKPPEQSESESNLLLGGAENVDIHVFDAFDYVALGHIHGPQRMGRDTIRYSGSPIKYSFSEVFHKKSVSVVEIKEKGNVTICTRELTPLHDMRKIKGKLEELMSEDVYSLADVNDYLHVTLLDRQELYDPMGELRSVYPNVMQIAFEKNERKKQDEGLEQARISVKRKNIYEHFQDFYQSVTGEELTEEEEQCMKDTIEEIGGEQQ
ncbi:exonuclease SbcCD subunit D [Anaerosporobacter faecicola]|uniref:exonuclease SbcCD subunit D n=1 Tax=Anaerosporobacter faecicola TaxID=2718714 RepID=UPI001439F3A5|nr:exonuclease SbcCD subunit D [Anaerosporobacter faecicola]